MQHSTGCVVVDMIVNNKIYGVVKLFFSNLPDSERITNSSFPEILLNPYSWAVWRSSCERSLGLDFDFLTKNLSFLPIFSLKACRKWYRNEKIDMLLDTKKLANHITLCAWNPFRPKSHTQNVSVQIIIFTTLVRVIIQWQHQKERHQLCLVNLLLY